MNDENNNKDKDEAFVASRRVEMVAKLEQQKEVRQVQRESRKEAMSAVQKDMGGGVAAPSAASSADGFWKTFSSRVKSVKEGCATQVATSNLDEMSALCLSWSNELTSLQELLNDCTIFLNAFDVRKAQKEVDTLYETVDEAKARLIPRKKFQFSRKRVAPSAPATNSGNNVTSSPSISSSLPSSTSSNDARNAHLEEDEHTVSDLTDTVVFFPKGHFTSPAVIELARLDREIEAAVKASVDSGGPARPPTDLANARRRAAANVQGRDIRLLNLTRCVVIILDPLRALRVDTLTDCQLFTGPIAGSVLLHTCTRCVFMLCARQLRIHTSTYCDYYLRCMSRPIIEKCENLAFSPYGIEYDGFTEQLINAALDKPARPDMWKCVDDFGWHRVQKSPNWNVLPKTSRIGIAVNASTSSSLSDLPPVRSATSFGSGITILSKSAVERGISIVYEKDTGEGASDENVSTSTAPAQIMINPKAQQEAEDEL
jgi:hypothetical protein